MVATSGWTLDEQGRAFSKSLGNGVDPVDVAKRLGGEIVRLWVASVDFREDVAASETPDAARQPTTTANCATPFASCSATCRASSRANQRQSADFSKLQPIDQYMLVRTHRHARQKRLRSAAYDAFEFHRVYQAINEFLNIVDLSSPSTSTSSKTACTPSLRHHPARLSAHKPFSGASPKR